MRVFAVLVLVAACQTRAPEPLVPLCGGQAYSAENEARVLNQLHSGISLGKAQIALVAFEDIFKWGVASSDQMARQLRRLDSTGQFTPEELDDFRQYMKLRRVLHKPNAVAAETFDLALA